MNRINGAQPANGVQPDYLEPIALPQDSTISTGMRGLMARINGIKQPNLVNDHMERVFAKQIPKGMERLSSIFARMQTQSRFDGLKPVVGTQPNIAFPGMPHPTETLLQTPPVRHMLSQAQYEALGALEKRTTLQPEEEAKLVLSMPEGTRVVKGTMTGWFRRGLGAIATGVRKAARIPGARFVSSVAKLGTQIAITAYVTTMAMPLFAAATATATATAAGGLLAGGMFGLGVEGSAALLGQLAGTLSMTVLSVVPKFAKGDVRGGVREIGSSITGFAVGQMVSMAGGPIGTFVGKISATVVGDVLNGTLWGFLIPTDRRTLQTQNALQVNTVKRLSTMMRVDEVQQRQKQSAMKRALFNFYKIGKRVVIASTIVATLAAALYKAPAGVSKMVVSKGVGVSAKMASAVFSWYKDIPQVRQFSNQLIGKMLPTGWITRVSTVLTERVMRRLKIEHKRVVPEFIRKRIHTRIANSLLFQLTYLQLLQRIQGAIVNSLTTSVVARAGAKATEYTSLQEAAQDMQANVQKAVESVQDQLKNLKEKAINTPKKAAQTFNSIIENALNAVGPKKPVEKEDVTPIEEVFKKNMEDTKVLLATLDKLAADKATQQARQAARERMRERQRRISKLGSVFDREKIIFGVRAREMTPTKSLYAQVMYEARLQFQKEAPEVTDMLNTPGMRTTDGLIYHVLTATGLKFLDPGTIAGFKMDAGWKTKLTQSMGYWDMMRSGLQAAKLTAGINAYYARKMVANNKESVSGWATVSSAWSSISSGTANVMQKLWVPPSSKQVVSSVTGGVASAVSSVTEAKIEENIMGIMGFHPFKTKAQSLLSFAVGDKPADVLGDVAKSAQEFIGKFN